MINMIVINIIMMLLI